MAHFLASICKMHLGNLVPFDSATVESESTPEAIEGAKRWANEIERFEDAWLHITLDGKGVATFKPGEF